MIRSCRSMLRLLCFGILVACGAGEVRAGTLDGLLGWWPFDGNGQDASGHGYDLTLAGAPGFAAGRFGQALSLDGTGAQYAIRPIDDAAFNLGSGDFTVQIWADFTTHDREQTLIEKFTGGGGPGWTFTTRTWPGWSDLQFYPAATSGNLAYPTQEWHQYVAERSGTIVSLLIDGNVVASATYGGGMSSSLNPLLIGRRNPEDGLNLAVDGLLDDAALWSRALSPTEIRSLYDSGFPSSVPEPGSLILLGAGLLAIAGRRRAECDR